MAAPAQKAPARGEIDIVLTAHHKGLSIALRNARGNLQYLPFHQRAGYMTDDDGNAGFDLVVSAAAKES